MRTPIDVADFCACWATPSGALGSTVLTSGISTVDRSRWGGLEGGVTLCAFGGGRHAFLLRMVNVGDVHRIQTHKGFFI